MSAAVERLSAAGAVAAAAAWVCGGRTAVGNARLALPAHELKREDQQTDDRADGKDADEPNLVGSGAALGRQEQRREPGYEGSGFGRPFRRQTPTHRMGVCVAQERNANIAVWRARQAQNA